MRRFKCTIQYDGTDYSGYQVQPNGLTIQEVLEKTLGRMHKHPVKVIGSDGRMRVYTRRGRSFILIRSWRLPPQAW